MSPPLPRAHIGWRKEEIAIQSRGRAGGLSRGAGRQGGVGRQHRPDSPRVKPQRHSRTPHRPERAGLTARSPRSPESYWQPVTLKCGIEPRPFIRKRTQGAQRTSRVFPCDRCVLSRQNARGSGVDAGGAARSVLVGTTVGRQPRKRQVRSLKTQTRAGYNGCVPPPDRPSFQSAPAVQTTGSNRRWAGWPPRWAALG